MVRFKNRWLLVEFIPLTQQGESTLGQLPATTATAKPLDGKKVWNALKQSVLTNFGDTGWGAVGVSLTVKYFSPTTNLCIIRVARDQHNVAWGALTLVTAIEGERYVPNVVRVSGTIKYAQLAAVEHNRQIIARYRGLAKSRGTAMDDGYDTFLERSSREIDALQD